MMAGVAPAIEEARADNRDALWPHARLPHRANRPPVVFDQLKGLDPRSRWLVAHLCSTVTIEQDKL